MTADSPRSSPAPGGRIEEALDAVETALRDQHAAHLETLRTEGFDPLRAQLKEAVEDHEEAREALSFDDTPTRQALWSGVRHYRQATTASVWAPVRTRMETLNLGTVLRDGRRELGAARETLSDEVPETVRRAEPEGLYASRDADGWGRRPRKALARGGRALRRLLGREETPTQHVPLADLVAHHAAAVLPGLQAPALDGAEQRLAQWCARLEREAEAWTHRLLECERLLDRPAFHDADAPLSVPEPSPDPTTSVMEADVEAVHADLLERAQSLHRCLEDGRTLRLDDVAEDLVEVVTESLDRAVNLLNAENDALARAGGDVLCRTWRATTEAWTDLHDRVRATGHTRAHALRLRGELVRGARWVAVEAKRRGRAATTQLRRAFHRLQRQGRRLVRLGHAAVGTRPVDEAALRETIDTLSTVDAVLADLPLVYRRLFSFRPLRYPDLLVGRNDDRTAVERHAEQWRKGLTNALVVTGPAGTGRTSLLNALWKTSFRSAQRHKIELSERVTSEAAFADHVVRALGLSLETDPPLTLDAVAEHLRAQPVPERLRVCAIEHFEHVFHRTVGGTALGARILEFLSETDTRVLWIATTTDVAWQFVEASESAAARLVTRHRLDPLDRTELESLIMRRHQRSGLDLSFEAPDESTASLLTRRLRSIDDEERRQELLRTTFFDHLHEVCGQNVMLALFYWFRSVTLDTDETTLRVPPLDPVSFDLLETLPLPHAFALKALLQHGTLTVEELATVLGVAPDISRSLLETLGNALLIAPADRVEGPGAFQFVSVEPNVRYRIRPLLTHPVTRFLRSRNIVHDRR